MIFIFYSINPNITWGDTDAFCLSASICVILG